MCVGVQVGERGRTDGWNRWIIVNGITSELDDRNSMTFGESRAQLLIDPRIYIPTEKIATPRLLTSKRNYFDNRLFTDFV